MASAASSKPAAATARPELPPGWKEGYREWLLRSRRRIESRPPRESPNLAAAALAVKQLAAAEACLGQNDAALRRAGESVAQALRFLDRQGASRETIDQARAEVQSGETVTLEALLAETPWGSPEHAAEATYLRAGLARRRLDFEAAYDLFRQAALLDPKRVRYVEAAADAALLIENDQDAEHWIRRALQLDLHQRGANAPGVGRRLNSLAFLYMQHMRIDEAHTCLQQAARLQTRASGAEASMTLRNKALLFEMRGMRQEASMALQRAEAGERQEDNFLRLIEKRRREHGDRDPRVARTHALLAGYLRQQCRPDEADEHYAAAAAILEAGTREVGAAPNRALSDLLEEWAQLKCGQGEPESAAEILARGRAQATGASNGAQNGGWFSRLVTWLGG